VTTLSTRKHTRTLARTLARAPSHTTLQLIDHNGIEALERTRTCLVLRCALTLKVASRRYVPQCCSSAAEIPHPPQAPLATLVPVLLASLPHRDPLYFSGIF
jgi:hypothetical protein